MKRESKIYAININSPRICILTMMQISKKNNWFLEGGKRTRGKKHRQKDTSKQEKKTTMDWGRG